MDWNKIKETVLGWLTTTGIKILVALLVLIVAFTLINRISKQIEKRSRKQEETKHVDKTVYRTLGYIAKIGLKILVLLSLVAYLGIDTGAITALIASLGVGVGLAVNGTLSNLAGGMLLLFTRPFKDGDYIAANGYEGYVEDIFICNTKTVNKFRLHTNLANPATDFLTTAMNDDRFETNQFQKNNILNHVLLQFIIQHGTSAVLYNYDFTIKSLNIRKCLDQHLRLVQIFLINHYSLLFPVNVWSPSLLIAFRN